MSDSKRCRTTMGWAPPTTRSNRPGSRTAQILDKQVAIAARDASIETVLDTLMILATEIGRRWETDLYAVSPRKATLAFLEKLVEAGRIVEGAKDRNTDPLDFAFGDPVDMVVDAAEILANRTAPDGFTDRDKFILGVTMVQDMVDEASTVLD